MLHEFPSGECGVGRLQKTKIDQLSHDLCDAEDSGIITAYDWKNNKPGMLIAFNIINVQTTTQIFLE